MRLLLLVLLLLLLIIIILVVLLLRSTQRKPNFDLSSLPFAISVPVHGDTGKLHYYCKFTKMASPQLIFQGALIASGREHVGDSRERAVASGPFYR